MAAEALKPYSPDVATEIREAQRGYFGAFLDIAYSRLQMPADLQRIKKIQKIKRDEEAGLQTMLRVEVDEDENPIELPKSLQDVVAQVFRGFPIDNETYLPQLRVNGVSFLYNRVAIDVEPTIETPRREGRERQFITFPDHSRAVSSRIGFFINKGNYFIGFGNPNGSSEWLTSHGILIPFKGERVQLAPEVINDLTALAHTVNARPHSDLRIHKAHS